MYGFILIERIFKNCMKFLASNGYSKLIELIVSQHKSTDFKILNTLYLHQNTTRFPRWKDSVELLIKFCFLIPVYL